MTDDAFHGLLLGALTGSVVLALWLLVGCASLHSLTKDEFPELCDIKQPFADGTGYTKGTFPCKLTRHANKEVQP